MRAQAGLIGCRAALVRSVDDVTTGISKADWIILTKNVGFLGATDVKGKLAPDPVPAVHPLVWTDDFAGLWQVMKR